MLYNSREPIISDDSLGYSFVWDNVQVLEEKRHHSLENTNTFHVWAMAFAVKNPISFATLEGIPPTMSATDIPLSTYMPSCADYSKGNISLFIASHR